MPSTLPPNPYDKDLNGRDPLDAMADTPGRIRHLVESWSPDQLERSYAPGKWSARMILIHLAQTELALGTRARFALSAEEYTALPFSQDDWMWVDREADAQAALDAYTSMRRLNLAMFRSLTADQRAREFTHPEYGTLSVWWVASQLAGHDIHHLRQLEAIARPS